MAVKKKDGKEREKKKRTSKIEKLKEIIKEKDKEIAEQRDKFLRLQADFDNYRKWVEKENINKINLANEKLIKELLAILDDFENAISKMKNGAEGMELIYKNFLKILEKFGLKKIEAVGKKFDPYYHEVVLQEESDEPEGTVLQELQKGYMLNSKIIRHAKVKIAKKKEN